MPQQPAPNPKSFEGIRTASETPIKFNLTDEDAVSISIRISVKVLHLRRLGMHYTSIAERLGVNLWMAKKAARWGNRSDCKLRPVVTLNR